jgi:hypothetical protein
MQFPQPDSVTRLAAQPEGVLPSLRPIGWRIALATVIIGGALLNSRLLFRFDVPAGVDGYYYQLQVQHILEHGTPHYPTISLLYLYLAAAVGSISGHLVSTLKVICIGLDAVLCLAAFSIVSAVTESEWLGVLSCLILETSVIHTYLVGVFNANLCGLAFLLCSLALLVHWPKSTTATKKLGVFGGIFCYFLSAAAHRSMVPLTFCFAICLACVYGLVCESAQRKLALVFSVAAWLAPGLISLFSHHYLPELAQASVQFSPEWPINQFGLYEKSCLLILSPLCLVLISRSKSNQPNLAHLLFGTLSMFALLVLLNPFLNFRSGPGNLSGRLNILSYLVLALLLPGVISLARDTSPRIAAVIAMIAAIGTPALLSRPLPTSLTDRYLKRRQELYGTLSTRRESIGPIKLILAQPGDQFLVTEATGIPSQAHIPRELDRERTFWLLDQIPSTMLDETMLVLLRRPNSVTALVPFNQLARLLSSQDEFSVEQLERENIHLYRSTHVADSGQSE